MPDRQVITYVCFSPLKGEASAEHHPWEYPLPTPLALVLYCLNILWVNHGVSYPPTQTTDNTVTTFILFILSSIQITLDICGSAVTKPSS